jgi:hypothetical protein
MNNSYNFKDSWKLSKKIKIFNMILIIIIYVIIYIMKMKNLSKIIYIKKAIIIVHQIYV